jgi:hypothetical protein
MCLPVGLSMVLPYGWREVAGMLAVIPGLLVAGAVLAALAAVILDLTAKERYDIFHWVGAAALFGMVGQVLALAFVSAALSPY